MFAALLQFTSPHVTRSRDPDYVVIHRNYLHYHTLPHVPWSFVYFWLVLVHVLQLCVFPCTIYSFFIFWHFHFCMSTESELYYYFGSIPAAFSKNFEFLKFPFLDTVLILINVISECQLKRRRRRNMSWPFLKARVLLSQRELNKISKLSNQYAAHIKCTNQ